MYPSYLNLYHNGKLEKLAEEALGLLKSCVICPRRCKVNRLNGEQGFCKTGLMPKVYSFMPHLGEEPPISGDKGSGAIFFSRCNMACVYCQNHEFSQKEEGREVGFEELAHFMLQLQDLGCHNINLVSPTHVMPQILKALCIAVPKGLNIPLVYNTGGYELPEMINLLNGIIDIYLPDMRYGDNDLSLKYSQAAIYPKYNQESVKLMQAQVGIAKFSDSGIIKQGLIIRHLVLPNNISGSKKIMEFISREISKDTYISLMSQYTPYFRAREFADISRRLTHEEYQKGEDLMAEYGLHNGWSQESGGLERFAGTNIKPNI